MVISLIWVAAWKMLMVSPTIMPARSMGPATNTTVCMADCPISMTCSGVIAVLSGRYWNA